MISIRRVNCDDTAVVTKLLRQKYSFSSDAEAAETFSAECSYQHYRLAELDGQPVGLISWRPQGSLRHGVAELTRLAVISGTPDPRAVKESLFDVMIAEADYFYEQHDSKLRKVFSMIHADSKHIRDFFQDKGMHQEAVLRSHFHAGTDELVYSMFIA